MQLQQQKSYFIFCLVLLSIAYLGFEFFFNGYATYSVDDFWFSHVIYQYRHGLPYKDFAPYKTVLGYYVLLLPMLISKNILHTIFYTKNFIAFLNISVLFIAAVWMRRFFSVQAILSSLILLLTSDLVLTYSTNIRADLFGYWFGLFALLALLDKRYFIAGILLGLGFITSQKVIWYVFALNFALGTHWLLFARNKQFFMRAVLFNLAFLMLVGIYVLFWSYFSSPQIVLDSMFTEASTMYQLDWYNSARKLFWGMMVHYNPFLFLSLPVIAISLFLNYKNDHQYQQRVFITVFSLAVLCQLIPYKQIFPYYMQVFIPVFLLVYASLADWLFNLLKTQQPLLLLKKNWLYALIATILVLQTCTFVFFKSLHPCYYLIIYFPIAIGVYIYRPQQFNRLVAGMIALTIAFTGLLFPMINLVFKTEATNGAYQRANVAALNHLLKDNNDYLAGIELIYNKTQPIAGMRHLMGPAVDFLYRPTPKLRKVMLASLYEDPNATIQSVIAALKASKVKLYVNNYRMMALPRPIKNYLTQEYEHLWGSIYIYAPSITAGNHPVNIKFSGNYSIEAKYSAIYLNNQKLLPNYKVYLHAGTYQSKSLENYRLKLIPDVALNPKFKSDLWPYMLN